MSIRVGVNQLHVDTHAIACPLNPTF